MDDTLCIGAPANLKFFSSTEAVEDHDSYELERSPDIRLKIDAWSSWRDAVEKSNTFRRSEKEARAQIQNALDAYI